MKKIIQFGALLILNSSFQNISYAFVEGAIADGITSSALKVVDKVEDSAKEIHTYKLLVEKGRNSQILQQIKDNEEVHSYISQIFQHVGSLSDEELKQVITCFAYNDKIAGSRFCKKLFDDLKKMKP